MKRIFDFLLSVFCILLFSEILVFVWFLAALSTKSNGIFVQKRVGRHGRLFSIYKFRTMDSDKKINKMGAFLRKFKLDEIPQLFNVLLGEMSFVGPRPDVPGYADLLKGEDRLILELRPGITGPASLKYANEESILKNVKDPIKYNDEVLFPDKVKINLDYYYGRTFIGDVKLIMNTLLGTK